MKHIKPNVTALYFLQIFLAIVAFGISLLCVIYLRRFKLLMYIIVGVVCALAFLMDFILMPLYFSRTSYTLDKNSISKKGGLLFTKKQTMKLSSVQYYTSIKTPLSSFTSLNFVIIHALGGVVILHYLSNTDIKDVENILSESLKGNEVGL